MVRWKIANIHGNTMRTEENLRKSLLEIARLSPPKLSAFAAWLAENLGEVAFLSIRALAQKALINPNLVPRLSRELGYEGYEAFKADVQHIIQIKGSSYGHRARALRERMGSDIYSELISASRENIDLVTSPDGIATIDACIEPLRDARRIYSVGVRSCYSIAHYLAYVGGMAFDNFAPVPAVPGSILDQMSETTPDDIVVAITYEHYSAEVVRACQIAQDRGARVLALTDNSKSPIARGAWKVILLPMVGPQLMPSLNSAFLAVEMILAALAAKSEGAADKVALFEERVTRFGGYFV